MQQNKSEFNGKKVTWGSGAYLQCSTFERLGGQLTGPSQGSIETDGTHNQAHTPTHS